MNDLTAIILGCAAAVAGSVLLIFGPGRERMKPLLAMPRTLANWLRLTTPERSDETLLSATELGYVAHVNHLPGWFWIDGGPEYLRVGRVAVPPGCIAVLEYLDRWSGVRFLDKTCFAGTDTRQLSSDRSVVIVLMRSARWQVTFGGRDLPIQNETYLNAHLAVHMSIEHTLADLNLPDSPTAAELRAAFSPLENAQKVIENWLKGRLKEQVERLATAPELVGSEQRYRAVMRAVPHILRTLNMALDAVRDDPADRSSAARVARVLRVEFTGLVFKPMFQAEKLNLEPVVGQLEQMRGDSNTVAVSVQNTTENWRTELRKELQHIEDAITRITGEAYIRDSADDLAAMGRLGYVLANRNSKPFAELVTRSALEFKNRNATLNIQSTADIQKLVAFIYQDLINELNSSRDQIVAACDSLQRVRSRMTEQRKGTVSKIEQKLNGIRSSRVMLGDRPAERPAL